MKQRCSDVVESLTRAAREGRAPDIDREHVAACRDCQSVVRVSSAFAASLSETGPEGEDRPERVSDAALSARQELWRVIRRRSIQSLFLLTTIAMSSLFILWTSHVVGRNAPLQSNKWPEVLVFEWVLALGMAYSLRNTVSPSRARWTGSSLVLITLPPALVGMFVIGGRLRPESHMSNFVWIVVAVASIGIAEGWVLGSGGVLYKRLRKGRLISGVCLGLAETVHVPVAAIRAIFVVLLFTTGGFWLYILFELMMQVHPEDRGSMLRYKVARWVRRRGGEPLSV